MAVAWMVSMKHPLRGLRGGDDAAPYSNHFEVGTEREYKIENSVQDGRPAGAGIAYQSRGGAGSERAPPRAPEASPPTNAPPASSQPSAIPLMTWAACSGSSRPVT